MSKRRLVDRINKICVKRLDLCIKVERKRGGDTDT